MPAVPFGRREWKYGNGQKIMTCMVTCKPCRPEVRQIAPAPLLKDLDAEREKAPYAMVVRFLHLALALALPSQLRH